MTSTRARAAILAALPGRSSPSRRPGWRRPEPAEDLRRDGPAEEPGARRHRSVEDEECDGALLELEPELRLAARAEERRELREVRLVPDDGDRSLRAIGEEG